MALLSLPRTASRDKPAVGPRLNPSHPLAAGLRHFFVLNEGAGRQVVDHAQPGLVYLQTGGGQPPAWVPGGLHWAGTWTGAAVGQVEQIQTPALIGTSLTTPHTLEMFVKLPAATSGCAMLLENSDGNTNGTCQGVGIGVGNTTMDNSGTNFIGLNEGVAWHASGAAIPTNIGDWTQIGLVWYPNPGTSVFFINGRRVGTGAWAALTASTGAAITLYVGGYFPAAKASGRVMGSLSIAHARHYTRALTDFEMQQLYTDPYAMLRPSNKLLSRAGVGSVAPPSPAWHTSLAKVWQLP